MSSIFVSNFKKVDLSSVAKQFAVTTDTKVMTETHDICSSVLSRVDDMSLWGMATDKNIGVSVFLGGRIALSETKWKAAESLPYQGGLACRWLLDKWLIDPDTFIDTVNGAFLIVIINKKQQKIDLFTDRLGMFPVYYAPDFPLTFCSHPDILADVLSAQGYDCRLDWTTLAEVIGTANATHPNTYYASIKSLDAGCHYRWKGGQSTTLVKERNYWQPAYLQDNTVYEDQQMVDELAEAIKKAVQCRTLERLGSSAVMLSGGVDSRAVLFGADDPSKMTAITLFDEENAELETAQKLAEIAKARHIALKRSHDYYAENAELSVKIASGMWSILDSHYLGFTDNIRKENFGTVLTGCYADYMFKGLLFNRTYRTLLGKTLPLFKPASFDFQYYHSHVLLEKTWQHKIQKRLNHRYPLSLRNDYKKNALIIEDLRLRPLIREPDASGRTILWQTLPWDHLLSDLDILKVYEKLSYQQKLNGTIFGKAVAKVVGGKAQKVPNNNIGSAVDASVPMRVLYFLKEVVKRKYRRLLGIEKGMYRLATTGSWPNWQYYVSHSPCLANLWKTSDTKLKQRFKRILGYDPWEKTIEEWAKNDHMLFMRLLTIKIWLDQRSALL